MAFVSAFAFRRLRTRDQSAFSAASASGASAAIAVDTTKQRQSTTASAPQGRFIDSNPHRREQLVELAVAVAELVEADARLVEERQVQVGEGDRLFEANV